MNMGEVVPESAVRFVRKFDALYERASGGNNHRFPACWRGRALADALPGILYQTLGFD